MLLERQPHEDGELKDDQGFHLAVPPSQPPEACPLEERELPLVVVDRKGYPHIGRRGANSRLDKAEGRLELGVLVRVPEDFLGDPAREPIQIVGCTS